MMKKTLITVCTALTVFSFAACAGKGVQPTARSAQSQQAPSAGTNTPSSSERAAGQSAGQGTLLSAGFVDLMKSGKFLIRYKVSAAASGETMEAEVTTATDGKSVASIMKMEGLTTHAIIKDNVLYLLDDANKVYSETNLSPEEKAEKAGSLVDMENPSCIGRGTGTVNGKTMPYEEYSAGGETLRFFMDGRKLYAIVSKTKDSEMVMTVLELTGDVPAGMLSVPSGYQKGTVAVVPGGFGMTGEQQLEEDNP